METRSRSVQVRVSEGVLWVEGEAYPLRNISHVGQRILKIDKNAARKKFIRRTISCLIVGVVLASIEPAAGVIIMLAVEALLIWRLISVINKPELYGLVLNTSGTQHDAVWSTESSEIQHLVQEVTKAIGHPEVAQVTYNVQHAVQGDLIQQYGDASIGKAQHSGSGNIGTR